jgi:hypothetical protein
MSWLTGKKTYIGAAGLAIGAVAGFHFGVYPWETAVGMLSLALAAAGLGHKYDRCIEIVLKRVDPKS